MRKILSIFLILVAMILFSGCLTNHIANTNDKFGTLYISGKWPSNSISSNISTNTINKAIHTDTQTITLTMTKSDGSQTITKSVTRSSNENNFTITLSNLEFGNWNVNITAKDSDGNILNSASKIVTINSTDNIFNAVFGPATYSEMFLPVSYAYFTGDYSYFYEVFGSLGIKQRVISGIFNVTYPVDCYWNWNFNNECISNAGAGTHVYTYDTNGKIISKAKDSTKIYDLSYNSVSRLNTFNSSTSTSTSNSTYSNSYSYNSKGLLSKSVQNSTTTGTGTTSYTSSNTTTINYSYTNSNLSSFTKNLVSSYSEDTYQSTSEYSYIFNYTWSGNSVIKFVKKGYYKDSSSDETFLSVHEEKEFVSSSNGVEIWTETHYDSSSSKTYEWELKYTDSDEDGNLDSITRTRTYDSSSGTVSTLEYTITFTYDTSSGKVSQVNYTDTSGTVTETLSY